MTSTFAELELLGDIARDAWAPRERISVSEFAEKYRRLDEKSTEHAGPWRNSIAPYLAGIMDAFNDPAIDEITVMKSSQVGMTEALINVILYIVACDPAPTMLVQPNREMVRQFCRDRIKPAIELCGRVKDELGEELDDQGTVSLEFRSMVMYNAGSNSAANLRSKPIKHRLVDDFDICDAGTGEEMRQRGNAFATGKFFKAGTPGYEGAGIAAEYELSDKRYFAVPCPHCGEYQELAWERVTWKGGSGADPDEVERTAYVQCVACKGKIENRHKLAALKAGVWLKEGQGVRSDGATERRSDGGKGITIVGRGKDSRHAGFRVSGLMSPFLSIGKVARGFVEAGGRPERLWWNGTLGRPWRVRSRRIETTELQKLVKSQSDGGHRFGEVPANAVALVGTVDVQSDRLFVEVDAYSAEGREAALVWCGEVNSTENDALWQLDAVLDRGYPMPDGRMLAPIVWGIDSGDRTDEVYRCVRRAAYDRVQRLSGEHPDLSVKFRQVYAIKGSPGTNQPQRHWFKTLVEGNGRGLKLFWVNTRIWKDQVAAQLSVIDRGDEDKEGEDAEIAELAPLSGRFVLPEGVPGWYLRHLTAEERVRIKSGRQSVMVWQLRQGRTDNHGWDTRVYNEALADAAGVKVFTERNKERALTARTVGWKGERPKVAAGTVEAGPAPEQKEERFASSRETRERLGRMR